MHSSKNFLYRTVELYDLVFLTIILIGAVFILNSYPMMKVRFDIWQHIGNIDRLVFDPNLEITRSNWHSAWAFIIRTIGVSDVFTHAIIVHRSQFILNAIIIYQASKQIFFALFEKNHFTKERNKNQWISSLALCSVMVWLTIIGTVSTFQQAWIMWYSVNYQITLSFLFLSIALIVNVMCLEHSKYISITKISIAFTLLVLIYMFHAGELAYLIFYLPIIVVCFAREINLKNSFVALIILGLIAFIGEKFYVDIRPELMALLLNGDFGAIQNKINIYGTYNIIGGNRYAANWNELYEFSIFLVVPVAYLVLKQESNVNKRVLLFIILSLVFCFIPNFKFTAGLASLISYDGIVNRYYFASLIFLVLPLCVYLVLIKFKKIYSPTLLIVFVFIILNLNFNYSKRANDRGVYYENVQSILKSVNQKEIDIGITNTEIKSIEVQLENARKIYADKNIVYCSTYDKGHVIKYIYRQENVAFDRYPDFYAFDEKTCLATIPNAVPIY
jgi:hypothetical protein